MNPDVGWADGFLLGRFAEFYAEVAEIKLAIVQGRLAAALGSQLMPESTLPNQVAAVSSRLASCLLRQQRTHGVLDADPGLQRTFATAQLIMAALADEIFILEIDWPGNALWVSHALERALFKRRDAGQEFFVRLDALLASQSRNALEIEASVVFLMALQLGFKGQHRGLKGSAVLQDYRRRLLSFSQTRRPPRGAAHAFPQAYLYTLSDGAERRLAPLTPWYRAGLIALAAYVVVSTGVWLHAVSPLHDQLQTLERAGTEARR